MLSVQQVSKSYKLYDKPMDRLWGYLLKQPKYRQYQALKGINIELADGEVLGILGQNGAGKSTLLKILAGVAKADQGEVRIDGRVTGLLELGTGFDGNLSGYDNITTNGLLIGMTLAEIQQRKEDIIAFSELGDFIHEPMRTYSSGMSMRLAFAIAIHAEPKCFLVDEALSVGDGYFQQKCMRKIKQFREAGGSLVFVSHDLNAVKLICDRVVVLDQGEIVAEGDAETAVNIYNRILAREAVIEPNTEVTTAQNYGTKQAEIMASAVWGEQSKTTTVASGEKLNLRICMKANEELPEITVGVLMRDRFGQDVFGTNSMLLGEDIQHVQAGSEWQVTYVIDANVMPGKYTFSVALHTQENHLHECFHWHDRIAEVTVAGYRQQLFSGICNLPTAIRVEETSYAT